MGVELSGKEGHYRLPWGLWTATLNIAATYGWKPMGTEAPTYEDDNGVRQTLSDWGGHYFSNDYQKVTTEDAANIADALEQSMEIFSDEGILANLIAWLECNFHFQEPEVAANSLKEVIPKFIEFCRAGSFYIG